MECIGLTVGNVGQVCSQIFGPARIALLFQVDNIIVSEAHRCIIAMRILHSIHLRGRMRDSGSWRSDMKKRHDSQYVPNG